MSEKKMCRRKTVSNNQTSLSRFELAEKIRDYARKRKIGWETAVYSLESTKHPVARIILKEVRQYARAKKIGFITALGRITNASKNL
jgi:hypothetical protein